MDLLVKDESPSQVSDAIKDLLFARTASKIEDIRPKVAASLFDDNIDLDEPQGEAVDSDIDLDVE